MRQKLHQGHLSLGNKAARVLWGITWNLMFRVTPCFPGFWAWRRFILRLFGAKVGAGVLIYPSSRIWAPWNLVLKDHSRIGPWSDIYSVDRITLAEEAWVSQYSYLCTATHDFANPQRVLLTGPIHIGIQAWVAADVFIGPGVKVGERAVVGARSSVFGDVKPWTVVAGNPARIIRKRKPDTKAVR